MASLPHVQPLRRVHLIPSSGVPMFLSELFASSARAVGVMPDVLPTQAAPESGLKVEIPRFATGASAASVAENSAASETRSHDQRRVQHSCRGRGAGPCIGSTSRPRRQLRPSPDAGTRRSTCRFQLCTMCFRPTARCASRRAVTSRCCPERLSQSASFLGTAWPRRRSPRR